MELRCVIEHITYHNHENGYSIMSTVGDRTCETYNILASKTGERNRVILQWNQGGNFSNPTLRTVKGISRFIN